MTRFNRLARKIFIRKIASPVSGRVVGLCYHSIHPSLKYRSATPEEFDEQMSWLKENCDVVPLGAIVDGLRRSHINPRPRIAITFDDGYVDNHEYALPILVKHGLPATFFVTAGFLANDPIVHSHFRNMRTIQDSNDSTTPMSWAQMCELAAAGMEVGAHSYGHPNLCDVSPLQLDREIVEARAIIEEKLGRSVAGIAYPFGKPKRHFNNAVIRAVQNAGYTYAVACFFRGVQLGDSRFAIPRFFATRDTIESLSAKIFGAWDYVGKIQEYFPGWLFSMLSRNRY